MLLAALPPHQHRFQFPSPRLKINWLNFVWDTVYTRLIVRSKNVRRKHFTLGRCVKSANKALSLFKMPSFPFVSVRMKQHVSIIAPSHIQHIRHQMKFSGAATSLHCACRCGGEVACLVLTCTSILRISFSYFFSPSHARSIFPSAFSSSMAIAIHPLFAQVKLFCLRC